MDNNLKYYILYALGEARENAQILAGTCGGMSEDVAMFEDLINQVRSTIKHKEINESVEEKDISNLSIDKIGLGKSTVKALTEAHLYGTKGLENPIISVNDLIDKSEGELLRITNFGRKKLNDVKYNLSKYNLQLKIKEL